MKRIRHYLSNLVYMVKITFKFAGGQYILSAVQFVMDAVTPFVNILFPKWILDELTGERNFNKLLLLLSLWAIVNGCVVLVRSSLNIFSGPYADKNIYRENMHYLDLDSKMAYSLIENGKTLDEQGRIGANLSLSNFANNTVFSLLNKLIQFLGYTYILTTLHPLAIAAILGLVFLNSLISKKEIAVEYAYQQDISPHRRRFAYLFRVLTEYGFAKETRINHADTWIRSKYADEQREYLKKFSGNQDKHFKLGLLSDLLMLMQTILLYLYCVIRVVNRTITIGDFSLYIGATAAFIGCAASLFSEIQKIRSLSQYIDDYRAFIKQVAPSEVTDCQNDIADSDKHEIEFKNVSFIYPGTKNYALKNVSFKITNGERLAIVGYNGAGKSTIIKLICRLYTPTEGEILYNGSNIATLKYEEYSKLLSVVFQDFNIYSLSLKENIVLNGRTDDGEIQMAIEKSGLSDKLKTLPRGLDTQLGREFDENGVEFSGGETQKVSCARAYYRNTAVIILDEPTASLDPVSEQQLYNRFNEIIGTKTAVYITHRLASVRFCDRLAVLVNGEMVEYGTHKELMKNKKVYYDMFTKQAKYYVDPAKEG